MTNHRFIHILTHLFSFVHKLQLSSNPNVKSKSVKSFVFYFVLINIPLSANYFLSLYAYPKSIGGTVTDRYINSSFEFHLLLLKIPALTFSNCFLCRKTPSPAYHTPQPNRLLCTASDILWNAPTCRLFFRREIPRTDCICPHRVLLCIPPDDTCTVYGKNILRILSLRLIQCDPASQPDARARRPRAVLHRYAHCIWDSPCNCPRTRLFFLSYPLAVNPHFSFNRVSGAEECVAVFFVKAFLFCVKVDVPRAVFCRFFFGVKNQRL